MKNFNLVIFLFSLYLISPQLSWSQKKKNSSVDETKYSKKERSFITNSPNPYTIYGSNKSDLRSGEARNLTVLYRRNSQGLLLGNKCAEDIMRDYKFRYSIVPRSYQLSGSRYFFHNTWANIKLFFKNGPFWKGRMRRKIRECQKQTGDYVD